MGLRPGRGAAVVGAAVGCRGQGGGCSNRTGAVSLKGAGAECLL